MWIFKKKAQSVLNNWINNKRARNRRNALLLRLLKFIIGDTSAVLHSLYLLLYSVSAINFLRCLLFCLLHFLMNHVWAVRGCLLGYFHIQCVPMSAAAAHFKQVKWTLASILAQKMYPCFLFCTFLRRTTDYAIELIDYQHHIRCGYPPHPSDISYFHTGHSHATFISAGQIFRNRHMSQYRLHNKTYLMFDYKVTKASTKIFNMTV